MKHLNRRPSPLISETRNPQSLDQSFFWFLIECMHMKSVITPDLWDITKATMDDLQHTSFLDIEFDTSPLQIEPLQLAAAPTVAMAAHIPPQTLTGTQKISIRVPAVILAAFKARARATGSLYQSQIIKALSATVRAWGSTPV